MRITKEMMIAGVPAVALRDVFKRCSYTPWSVEDLAEMLALPSIEAREVTEELLREGFIEADQESAEGPFFVSTVKGAALANASAAKPITRKTADRLVAELIQRATAINESTEMLHLVTRVYVFGSYITDRPDLGDVDVAVELTRKIQGRDYIAAAELYADTKQAEGRRFRSSFERLVCAETDVLKTLGGSSKAISLHMASELAELGVTDSQLVYEYP